MRRALTGAFLMLLILGPFAAQAEAAETFARSLAELIQPDVIEPGDANDPAPCELCLKAECPAGFDQAVFSTPVFEGLTLLRRMEFPGFAPASRLCDDPPWPSHRRDHRFASLQNYLC